MAPYHKNTQNILVSSSSSNLSYLEPFFAMNRDRHRWSIYDRVSLTVSPLCILLPLDSSRIHTRSVTCKIIKADEMTIGSPKKLFEVL